MEKHTNLELYRRRHIPDELIHLKDDHVLQYIPNQLLITEWKTLKPRKDFARGVSAYFLEKGIKISKLITADNALFYWYCDIGMFHYQEEGNRLTFEDLLFDVIVYANGSVDVLDIDEAAAAFRSKRITEEQLLYGMEMLSGLLAAIRDGRFLEYQKIIDQACSLF